MKPKSYMEPSKNRCGTCKHAFCLRDYDCKDMFFCTFNDVEKRPLCGSDYLNESFFLGDRLPETFKKNLETWEAWAWAEQREVCAFGCCDEYKEDLNVVR